MDGASVISIGFPNARRGYRAQNTPREEFLVGK